MPYPPDSECPGCLYKVLAVIYIEDIPDRRLRNIERRLIHCFIGFVEMYEAGGYVRIEEGVKLKRMYPVNHQFPPLIVNRHDLQSVFSLQTPEKRDHEGNRLRLS